MIRFFVLLGFLGVVACGGRTASRADGGGPVRPSSSMVGGAPVSRADEASRSLVALVMAGRGGDSLCSGTILDERTVLTAAHCVDHDPRSLSVVFGPRVRGVSERFVREADALAQHPAWRPDTGRGDVALVRFRGGLPPGFEPVTLAGPAFRIEPHSELLMIGYGLSNPEHGTGAGTLRQTRSVILGFLRPDQIVIDERQSGACFGDSGGPAFTFSGNQVVQVGLAHSVMNETCNAASLYTGVMLYTDWIERAVLRLARIGD